MSGSREGFLSKGVTAAALNLAGKVPSEKERFASLAMSSENTDGQSLSKDVGKKSTKDDLDGMDAMSLRTSSTVTAAMKSKDSPKCTGSRKGMNVRLARVKAIVRFSDDILSEKKSENFLHSCLSSSFERSCTVLNEWSSDFVIRQRSLESTAEDSWDRKYSCRDEFMSLFACRQALR